MRFSKLLLFLGAAALFLAPHPAPAEPAAQPLIIGMEMAYPPFEMTGPDGAPKGISVDLGKAMGEALHRPVRFENIPFAGLIPALKTGKIHCIISSLTVTAERARSIDFSDPYIKTGLCVLAGKNSGIEKFEDVDQPGKTVVVKLGTTGHIYASRHLKHAKVVVLDKDAECVLEVAQGKVDALLYDQIFVYANWRKNPETTRALLKPFQVESWGIGIRKGDDALREQINRFLKEFRADGGFEKLGDKWLAGQREEFQKLGSSFLF